MEQMITSLGFPIACVIGLALWVDKQMKNNREDTKATIELIREDAKEDKNKMIEEITYNREVNSKLLATNELLAKDLSFKLDKVLEKVGE